MIILASVYMDVMLAFRIYPFLTPLSESLPHLKSICATLVDVRRKRL